MHRFHSVAECTVSNTHFKTFDGQRFDFPGTCDYILAQQGGTFAIVLEDVPCGNANSESKSCGKALKVMVNGTSVHMVKRDVFVNTVKASLPYIGDGILVKEVRHARG